MSDLRDPQRDQPLPVPGGIPVQDVLVGAIAERRAHGVRKYGRPLETHNGRDALTDAWEEALDLVTYLTQMRLERGDTIPGADPVGHRLPDALLLARRAETAEAKVAAGLELAGRLDQFAAMALKVPDSQLYQSLADSIRGALASPATTPAPTGSGG